METGSTRVREAAQDLHDCARDSRRTSPCPPAGRRPGGRAATPARSAWRSRPRSGAPRRRRWRRRRGRARPAGSPPRSRACPAAPAGRAARWPRRTRPCRRGGRRGVGSEEAARGSVSEGPAHAALHARLVGLQHAASSGGGDGPRQGLAWVNVEAHDRLDGVGAGRERLSRARPPRLRGLPTRARGRWRRARVCRASSCASTSAVSCWMRSSSMASLHEARRRPPRPRPPRPPPRCRGRARAGPPCRPGRGARGRPRPRPRSRWRARRAAAVRARRGRGAARAGASRPRASRSSAWTPRCPPLVAISIRLVVQWSTIPTIAASVGTSSGRKGNAASRPRT